MPLYEFKCKTGHTTERLLQSHTANVTCGIVCPKCGKFAERVEFPHTGAPILKPGIGGFYKATTEEKS